MCCIQRTPRLYFIQVDHDVSESVPTRNQRIAMQQGLYVADDVATMEMSVFQIQPLPAATMLVEHNGVTAIARMWVDGDHRRCRLCPSCHATDNGLCLITVTRPVGDSEADLYSLRGLLEETDLPCLAIGAT